MLNCGEFYEWQKLDPDKAEHRAIWGLQGPKGSTFLILENGNAIAVGLWSGIYAGHEEAFLTLVTRELHSLDTCLPGMSGIDRKIMRSVFKSWVVE
jgi:hypothetical protein